MTKKSYKVPKEKKTVSKKATKSEELIPDWTILPLTKLILLRSALSCFDLRDIEAAKMRDELLKQISQACTLKAKEESMERTKAIAKNKQKRH